MNRQLAESGRALALVACLLVACAGSGGDGGGDAKPVTVTRSVPMERAATVTLTGTVTAERRARLSPQVSGLVKAVRADAGDTVTEGAVLLELDAALASLEVKRTGAALTEARARLDEARRLVSASESAGRGVPERTLGARTADAEALEASVTSLEAELSSARQRLAYHRVRAPFDGVVSARLTDAGEWVSPGTAVFELVAVDRVRLDLQAPQELYGAIGPGTPVTVTPAGGRASVPGAVTATVPVTDASTRTFLVRVALDEPLPPGTSAEATLELPDRAESAVSVPRDAIIRYPDGSTSVWVVVGDGNGGTVEERQVRVAPGLAATVAVADLEPDVQIVVRGNERLRAGDRVRITGTEPP